MNDKRSMIDRIDEALGDQRTTELDVMLERVFGAGEAGTAFSTTANSGMRWIPHALYLYLDMRGPTGRATTEECVALT